MESTTETENSECVEKWHQYEQWKQASYEGKDLQVSKYKKADLQQQIL